MWKTNKLASLLALSLVVMTIAAAHAEDFARVGCIKCLCNPEDPNGVGFVVCPDIPNFEFDVTIRDANGGTTTTSVAPHSSSTVSSNGVSVTPSSGNTWATVWNSPGNGCDLLDIVWPPNC